jgi:hypothetical protein
MFHLRCAYFRIFGSQTRAPEMSTSVKEDLMVSIVLSDPVGTVSTGATAEIDMEAVVTPVSDGGRVPFVEKTDDEEASTAGVLGQDQDFEIPIAQVEASPANTQTLATVVDGPKEACLQGGGSGGDPSADADGTGSRFANTDSVINDDGTATTTTEAMTAATAMPAPPAYEYMEFTVVSPVTKPLPDV